MTLRKLVSRIENPPKLRELQGRQSLPKLSLVTITDVTDAIWHILKAGLDPGLWTLDSGLFLPKLYPPPEKNPLYPPHKTFPSPKKKFLPPTNKLGQLRHQCLCLDS